MSVMGVRRNIYDLDANDRGRFIDAMLRIKASGVYDRFVALHQAAMNVATPMPNEPFFTQLRNAAHRGPSFLPWHREFLRRLEIELDREVPGVTLPYWDWAADAGLPDPTQARIWTPEFVGGSGDPGDNYEVKDGQFVRANWPIPQDMDGPALRRRLGTFEVLNSAGNPEIIPFVISRKVEENAALNETTYDTAPWGRYAPGFRNNLEGWRVAPALSSMHNAVHVWVGGAWIGPGPTVILGSMLPGTSPNDPIFFLHHCFVDKIWADWQDRQEQARPEQFPHYQPILNGPLSHQLFDAMYPWGPSATPASVLDNKALGIEYAPTVAAAPAPAPMVAAAEAVIPEIPEAVRALSPYV